MRYIRFLKTPRIVQEKRSSAPSVSCLITITSDLGDSFFPYQATLCAELCSEGSAEALLSKTVNWATGMRSLQITFPFNLHTTLPIHVRIGVVQKSLSDCHSTLAEGHVRGVVSAWSAPLDPAKGVNQSLKLVERQFNFSSGAVIQIWEETGESIARHLWYM